MATSGLKAGQVDVSPERARRTCACGQRGDGARFLDALRALGRHPNCEILWTLEAGSRRFCDIAAASNFPEAALSAALRELDADDLISRRVVPGRPLRVIYELTPAGLRLIPAIRSLVELAEQRASATPQA
jgi:DNA-binding HxlR family transcriptional regulator